MPDSQLTRADYASKDESYYQQHRPEMLAFIPAQAKTLLDVGCSYGHFGQAIKARQSCEIWGVEMMDNAATVAAQHLERVFTAMFDERLPLPTAHFDCIIFNDCLEHMEHPESAIQLCKRLLRPGGVVVASIPNMRYYPVMQALILRGEWEYADWGVMDRTHLRFFTKRSINNLFTRLGYEVVKLEGINGYLWGKGRLLRLLNAVTFGRFSDVAYQQFAVVARVR